MERGEVRGREGGNTEWRKVHCWWLLFVVCVTTVNRAWQTGSKISGRTKTRASVLILPAGNDSLARFRGNSGDSQADKVKRRRTDTVCSYASVNLHAYGAFSKLKFEKKLLLHEMIAENWMNVRISENSCACILLQSIFYSLRVKIFKKLMWIHSSLHPLSKMQMRLSICRDIFIAGHFFLLLLPLRGSEMSHGFYYTLYSPICLPCSSYHIVKVMTD